MSIECGICERDLRGGHADDCSRNAKNVKVCLCRKNQFLRDPYTEGQQGKYSMPNHHPDCDAYKTENFLRIEIDGSWCICELHDLDGMVEGESEPERVKLSLVKLTRDQFERLPEFQGW